MSRESEMQVNLALERIKYQYDIIKYQYDFYKHMTTLTTGAFLVIVALMGGVFQNPKGMVFIIISLSFFSVSLIFSILEMDLFASLMQKLWDWAFRDEGGQSIRQQIEPIRKKSKVYVLFSQYGFWAGMVFLLVFAFVNVFK